jgi:protein NrfD
VSSVFFLFLAHSSLGLLATLPLIPDKAGARFFKFCSATAAFMTTAGLWLLQRRHGLDARPEILAFGAFLLLTVVYNRAWHFGWTRLQRPLLAAALLAGTVGVLAGAPAPRALVAATDLTSVLLLGATASAMILGHWYLVVLDLPITALRRVTVLLVLGLVLRAAVVAVVLAGGSAAFEDARRVALGLWSPDGVFVWMRLLFGLAGPLSLIWFIWKTVEIRSTQSATGILYVQLFLVMSGELLAKYLRVAAGLPL